MKRQTKEIPEMIRHLIKIRQVENEKNEFYEILRVVSKNPESMIPYEFIDGFKQMPVDIGYDNKWNLPFAKVAQHRVFFPRNFTPAVIRYQVRQSLWEQADGSPHRYIHSIEQPPSGDFAVLIGASNCIFTLSIIERFNKMFLFEPDTKWHPAMHRTLSRYSNKVVIVGKKVGNNTVKDMISLDEYFKDQFQQIEYIQADIEGGEMGMLWGAENLIRQAPRLNLSICCYHNAHDETEIGDFLKAREFTVRPSKGYMLLFMQYPLRYPYLRRGVVYASKCGIAV
jgi:hypothetical protein